MAYYQSLIGILRWIVELGRVDITTEVSLLASMMAAPREGHLYQALRVFSHLQRWHNAELVFDPTIPSFDDLAFPKRNWENTPFTGSIEVIPSNAPEARGFGFYVLAYSDSDHAGDMITRP